MGSHVRDIFETCTVFFALCGPRVDLSMYSIATVIQNGTVNFLNIRTPKKFVVISLKFQLCGSTIP